MKKFHADDLRLSYVRDKNDKSFGNVCLSVLDRRDEDKISVHHLDGERQYTKHCDMIIEKGAPVAVFRKLERDDLFAPEATQTAIEKQILENALNPKPGAMIDQVEFDIIKDRLHQIDDAKFNAYKAMQKQITQ